MRYVWSAFGIAALVLGVVGIAVPLLPTVPFLLLAAFCFARSSPRLHGWLVNHPRLGPPIRQWQREKAISRRAKRLSTISIAAVFAISIVAGVATLVLVVQGLVLAAVLVFIWTRPNGSAEASASGLHSPT